MELVHAAVVVVDGIKKVITVFVVFVAEVWNDTAPVVVMAVVSRSNDEATIGQCENGFLKGRRCVPAVDLLVVEIKRVATVRAAPIGLDEHLLLFAEFVVNIFPKVVIVAVVVVVVDLAVVGVVDLVVVGVVCQTLHDFFW